MVNVVLWGPSQTRRHAGGCHCYLTEQGVAGHAAVSRIRFDVALFPIDALSCNKPRSPGRIAEPKLEAVFPADYAKASTVFQKTKRRAQAVCLFRTRSLPARFLATGALVATQDNEAGERQITKTWNRHGHDPWTCSKHARRDSSRYAMKPFEAEI